MGAPVKNTCPDIDRAIKHLKTAIGEAKGLIEDKKDFQSIEWEIDNAIGYFEELRKANDALRQWGEGLESELHEAGDIISDLEDKLSKITVGLRLCRVSALRLTAHGWEGASPETYPAKIFKSMAGV